MLKFKQVMAAILIIVVAVALISCNLIGKEEEVVEENEDLIVVGFSQPGAESAWRVALTESVRNSFTEENGYKLIYKDGQSKQDNQIRDIRTFIQQGVDYIILSPIVETGWDTVLSEAKDAGIPVIICDRNVVVANESLYTAFVGSDFKAEGETAVAYIEKIYKPDMNGVEPEINIVHIKGTEGSSAQLGRTKALNNALEEHENWNVVYEGCGEFTKAKAREIMEQVLEEVDSKDIDVLYCENDEMAFGAIAALNEAGIPYGKGTPITVVSFDATTNSLELCKNRQIDIVVECNPLQGPYLYNIVKMLNKGKTVPKITYIDEKYFTLENLTDEVLIKRKY